MILRAEKNSKITKLLPVGAFTKTITKSCLSAVIVLSLLASTQVLAESAKKQDERFGGFTLADESMLGRYGDVNDEWVQPASSQVSVKPIKSAKKTSKSGNRLGAYSAEDNAMLGRYGDVNDE